MPVWIKFLINWIYFFQIFNLGNTWKRIGKLKRTTKKRVIIISISCHKKNKNNRRKEKLPVHFNHKRIVGFKNIYCIHCKQDNDWKKNKCVWKIKIHTDCIQN